MQDKKVSKPQLNQPNKKWIDYEVSILLYWCHNKVDSYKELSKLLNRSVMSIKRKRQRLKIKIEGNIPYPYSWRKNQSKIKKGKNNPSKRKGVRKKISNSKKGIIPWNKGLTNIYSDETIKKISNSSKKRWNNKEFVKKWAKAKNIKPNKSEIELLNILNRLFPNEYKYCGDFNIIIGGKCPDFINCNGKKKLIELYGDYWHKDEKNDDGKSRIDYFKQYGYDTLIIWEHELEDKTLIDKLEGFHE